MNRQDFGIGRLCFEQQTRTIPVKAIAPLKPLRGTIKQTQKYRQIAASIHAVGLIEPPVLLPDTTHPDSYFLLDGQLRLEVLKDMGTHEVECLISTDDDTYTYNKRINRLSVVQEHRMITRAVERGVPPERIADALNLSAFTIRQKFRLLDGLCPEVVSLLAEKPCTMAVFKLLKRMKPLRQMHAAELAVGQHNYSSRFMKAILVATPPDQLADARHEKPPLDVTREQIVRLERELEETQRRTRFVEDTFGDDNLCLIVAQTYLSKLLGKPAIVRWLSKHRADYLAEFQAIVALTSLSSTTANHNQ